ncbi:MAG: 4-hydroxy-tetrahydrodipicolinate reductase [Xanthomonadales bacterium]|nr:4-hydroxy-tetrahydrodipicolinate reductase [Xanthomonadales bacterium]
MLNFAIHGTGRMARAVVAAASEQPDLRIVALVGRSRPDWPGAPACFDSLPALPERPDLLIDFSLPEGTRSAAPWCAQQRVALLSGVTGLPDAVTRALRQAAAAVPVLWAPNLSVGVNLLALLAGRAAAVLEPDTPVVIEDIHHQWKKDAPSGTALMLGAAITAERQGDRDAGAGAIEYRSERRGEVIGDHLVRFALQGETLELAHRAQDRAVFARGALDAGRWLAGREAGFYAACDWLSGRMGGV